MLIDKFTAYKKLPIEDKNDIIEKGFNAFKTENEWDMFLQILITSFISILPKDVFNNFDDSFTLYIYNNLTKIEKSKEYKNLCKKPIKNEKLYKQMLEFFKERNKKFAISKNKYRDECNKNSINKEEEIRILSNNKNDKNNNEILKELNTKGLKDLTNKNDVLLKDIHFELLTAILINNSLIKREKEEEIWNEDKSTIPMNFEIKNSHISEKHIIPIISGIKLYNNITEINFSSNSLGEKGCFWLGTIFKTNPNIHYLNLSRCKLNNDCLYMLLEGTLFKDSYLNDEQYNLERLNLMDNIIADITNNNFEHPLCLILRKFKLRWLNLTNAKIGNSVACKFFSTYLELMKDKKIFMQTLILISNNIGNEKCLSYLGKIISQKNVSTLENLILSENNISTFPKEQEQKMGTNQNGTTSGILQINQNEKKENIQRTERYNYFKEFMEKLGDCNVKELYLISCGIGKDQEDIDILYNMLCKNKSLETLNLFGNEINTMEKITKILGVFSGYDKNLKNDTLKSLNLGENQCSLKINKNFWNLIEKLKLEYLDIHQKIMDADENNISRIKVCELPNIKIVY
jgi:hypothetical protein